MSDIIKYYIDSVRGTDMVVYLREFDSSDKNIDKMFMTFHRKDLHMTTILFADSGDLSYFCISGFHHEKPYIIKLMSHYYMYTDDSLDETQSNVKANIFTDDLFLKYKKSELSAKSLVYKAVFEYLEDWQNHDEAIYFAKSYVSNSSKITPAVLASKTAINANSIFVEKMKDERSESYFETYNVAREALTSFIITAAY